MFTVQQENATKFGSKSEILPIFFSLNDFFWLYENGFMHNFI